MLYGLILGCVPVAGRGANALWCLAAAQLHPSLAQLLATLQSGKQVRRGPSGRARLRSLAAAAAARMMRQ